MDPRLRILTRLPLTELWNDDGLIQAECVGAISKSEIESLIQFELAFVIADVGQPLEWLDRKVAFAFWKAEAQARIADPRANAFRLEDYPGCYCYVAKRWELPGDKIAVVFEKQH